jgi:hypothetical protein
MVVKLVALGMVLPLLAAEEPESLPQPEVLVLGFATCGELLESDTSLPGSLAVLTEAVLAGRYRTVPADRVARARRARGLTDEWLRDYATARLDLAKLLEADLCVAGRAVSFCDRVFLEIEVIDAEEGLPGEVHRTTCRGLEAIPEAVWTLLTKALAVGPAYASRNAVQDLLARIPSDDLLDRFPSPAYLRLVELREAPILLLHPARLAEALRLLEEVAPHLERLKADPRYRAETKWRNSMRIHPIFASYELDAVSRPPYLLFVERTADGERNPEADDCARALAELYREFHAHIGQPLELPRLEERPDPFDGILKVVVLASPESLARYHLRIGRGRRTEEISCYYLPDDQWITAGLRACGADSPTRDRRLLVREGVRQLLHAHARLVLSARLGRSVEWEDRRLRVQQLWLHYGLGALFAGAMSTPGEPWDLGTRSDRLTSRNLARLASARGCAPLEPPGGADPPEPGGSPAHRANEDHERLLARLPGGRLPHPGLGLLPLPLEPGGREAPSAPPEADPGRAERGGPFRRRAIRTSSRSSRRSSWTT